VPAPAGHAYESRSKPPPPAPPPLRLTTSLEVSPYQARPTTKSRLAARAAAANFKIRPMASSGLRGAERAGEGAGLSGIRARMRSDRPAGTGRAETLLSALGALGASAAASATVALRHSPQSARCAS